MTKILFLGPRTNRLEPELTGGAIVLFENLVEQCEKSSINYHVIDTNKKNYPNLVYAYLSIVLQLLRFQREVGHISLHSSRDYIILGLLVVFIGKVFGKATSLRKFGGEAANDYRNAEGIKKKILHFIFSKMDTLFFEMKHLVSVFSEINPNTYWFPNVRRRLIIPELPRSFSKKFVFISHVRREKGVDEILEVSNRFDTSYTFDIYGPIVDSKYTPEYFDQFRANYKYPLVSGDVLSVLNQYDVVLLPSYKEGYPGIIIEAYSLGIPVIATNLPGILEISENQKTGILVDPKNVDELESAIRYMNEDNYSFMTKATYRKFDEFDADIQAHHFFKYIGAL